MDSFYRILRFGKNYSAAAWAAVLFYVVYTLFQLAGIGMIIPVMDIILNNGSQFELTQDGSNQLIGLQDYINNIVNQGVLTYGSYGILWRACLISFGLFLAKNIFRYALSLKGPLFCFQTIYQGIFLKPYDVMLVSIWQ